MPKSPERVGASNRTMKASKYMIAAAIAATFVACRKGEVSDAIDDRSTGADPALLSNEDQHVDASQDADAIVEGNDSTYVGVTDATGRFRLRLPRDIRPDQVSPRCSKRGYKLVKFIKRPPPRGATTPVEIDFILGFAPR